MRSLISGFGWNAGRQACVAIAMLVVFPIAVRRLGLSQYGTFVLATSAVGVLTVLDGGMTNAALRYLGISAGAANKQQLTSQFFTILLMVAAISCSLGAAIFLFAGHLVGAFNLGTELRPAGIYAARVVGVLVPLGMVQGTLNALLQAHGRFAYMSVTAVACQIAYVFGVILFVHHTHGLQTIMRITLVQQIVYLALTLPSASRLLRLRGVRLLPRSEIREILTYSTRVQLFNLLGFVSVQADTLIIGALLSVRSVAIYGTGANVAFQLRSVPLNLGGPLVSRLAQTHGRDGAAATFLEYQRLQRIWVTLSTGFCAIAIGAAAFQIEAWLGHRFLQAGVVCVVITAGNLINLLTLVLTVYLQVIGKPQIEVRYSLISAVVNIGLTVGTAWLGLYAIVAATTVGQVVGSVALVSLARRGVSSEIPSFLTPAPWLSGALTAILTGAAAFLLQLISPWQGVLGLLLVSLSWIPGAIVFWMTLTGAANAWSVLMLGAQEKSLRPLVDALS